jgi:hypothetical protein
MAAKYSRKIPATSASAVATARRDALLRNVAGRFTGMSCLFWTRIGISLSVANAERHGAPCTLLCYSNSVFAEYRAARTPGVSLGHASLGRGSFAGHGSIAGRAAAPLNLPKTISAA